MLAEGALHVLLVGNRWVQSNVDDTIEFLDVMLGVASLATNSAVSATRFKSEHERVFKAKQEWQCSVDVLDQLICLVDRGGQVMRANKAVETLGLGGALPTYAETTSGNFSHCSTSRAVKIAGIRSPTGAARFVTTG